MENGMDSVTRITFLPLVHAPWQYGAHFSRFFHAFAARGKLRNKHQTEQGDRSGMKGMRS